MVDKASKRANEAARRAAARDRKPETRAEQVQREFRDAMALRAAQQAGLVPVEQAVPAARGRARADRRRSRKKSPEPDQPEVLMWLQRSAKLRSQLLRQLEQVERDRHEVVARARAEGLPWTVIAASAGVSRQALMKWAGPVAG